GALRLTTARYYTPSGRSIQAKGIEPEVVVDEELPDDLKQKADALGTRGERVGLLLEIVRQFLIDHNLGLDALGLDRAPRRRVIARGGKPERTVRAERD